MAVTFIGQSVALAIIENLVDTCSSYLKTCPAASGMQDELDRLQYALPQVQAVLTAVEEDAPAMMQNKGLDKWLWLLRDAVENAENVLDELEYYEMEKRIRDRDDEVCGNILSECKTKIDSFINRIFSDDTLKRLREAVKGLDRVVASIGPFLQIATGIYGHNVKRQKLEEVKNARETSSLLIESEVFGRDKERDTIVEWLIKPVDGESEGLTFNVSAYTIIGMGGLGKTTLAQLIHQDERVQRYFDPIMWVCISQDFNAATITKNIVEEINHKSSDHMHSLNALHRELKEKLTPKRFLLILDDVWNDNNRSEWEKLVAPLKFGQRGSKILLTTRMGSVADMAATVMQYKRESLDLNDLEERDCMLLFNKHAFLGVNPDDYKNLQPIGEQIVKKLRGCPLAIKVMGGLLNSYMNYDYWKRILKEDAMTVLQEENDIKKVLKLSYDHLPIYLQQEYFKALRWLKIEICEKLEYVPPEFFWKSNPLTSLRIRKCPKLTTRGISDIQLPSTLDRIYIGSCGDLEVPLLRLLPNLASFTWLDLSDCASITSLPTAQVCARWTMLSNLKIENCKELSSLGGIQALISLCSLQIKGCDKLIEVARLETPFPNDVGQENALDYFLKLGELSIDHHALLLIEPLRSLSSISTFVLYDASPLTSLPEEWLLQNHSALKELRIWNACSLQSLPQSMTKLCSLEIFHVENGKLIQSLPDLPTSLRYLGISGCHPVLKERCQENIGLDWPKIANIPKVDVRIELKFDKYYF